MIAKREWHQPKFQLLDARETAQTDLDALLSDPNGYGDLVENSENASSWGNAHAQADHS